MRPTPIVRPSLGDGRMRGERRIYYGMYNYSFGHPKKRFFPGRHPPDKNYSSFPHGIQERSSGKSSAGEQFKKYKNTLHSPKAFVRPLQTQLPLPLPRQQRRVPLLPCTKRAIFVRSVHGYKPAHASPPRVSRTSSTTAYSASTKCRHIGQQQPGTGCMGRSTRQHARPHRQRSPAAAAQPQHGQHPGVGCSPA